MCLRSHVAAWWGSSPLLELSTGTGMPESNLCPHAACQEQLATLSYVMLSCPVSKAVW